MEKDDFLLTKVMEVNYNALQRYLSNQPTVRPRYGRKAGAKSPARKLAMLEQQDYRCLDCGIEFIPDENGLYPTATVDHIIPKRFGGRLDFNSEFVCEDCNKAREHNRHHHVMRFFGTITEN